MSFPDPEIIVVDTSAKMSSLVDEVCSLDHAELSSQLAIDLERAKIRREGGDVSIMQISRQKSNAVYFVDV